MSDYTYTSNFGAKDGLSSGDPDKLILGTDFDTEFNAIATAIGTKFDSANYANQAEAEAGTNAVKLMTPEATQYWGDANGGMVGDIRTLVDPAVDTILGWYDASKQAISYAIGDGLTTAGPVIEADILGLEDLTDPGADRILFWDESAGFATFLTVSTGLSLTGTSLTSDDSTIVHDNLQGYDPNDHVDHSTVSITAGNGLTGGGTIAATRTLDLDISGLTGFSGPIATADGFLVDDGGTMKRFAYNDAGLVVNNVGTSTDILATADMNTYIRYTNATSTAVTLGAGVGETGNVIIIERAAGPVTLGGGATFNAAIGTSPRDVNSVIILVCTSAGTWTVYGDCSA